MKVFVVIEGNGCDERVEAVFSSRAAADNHCRFLPIGVVQEVVLNPAPGSIWCRVYLESETGRVLKIKQEWYLLRHDEESVPCIEVDRFEDTPPRFEIVCGFEVPYQTDTQELSRIALQQAKNAEEEIEKAIATLSSANRNRWVESESLVIYTKRMSMAE